MNLLQLFWMFFKVGLFTFGGGYAMIPYIKEEIIEKRKLMTDDDILELIAIAESTPGPIAINMATFIGFKQKKFLGSLLSTIGVILPSFIIIFIISLFFKQFMGLEYVKYAFVGINCAVAFLILKAGLEMFLKSEKSIFNIIIFIVVVVLMISFELLSIHFSSIFLILIGGILGLIINSLNKLRKEDTK